MTTVVDLGKLRFYWAGTYNAATEYELNDVVKYGGNVYVYINTTKTTGNEPTDTVYWGLMVEGVNFVGEWDSATQYFVGDTVAYGSTVYVALVDNTDTQPDTNPATWSQFVEAVQFEGVYNSGTTYQPNDIVTYGPSAYIAKATTVGNDPSDTANWDPLVSGISPEGVYNNATAYVEGDIVAYGANLYVAKGNTTGNLPTNATYWDLFVDTIRTRGDWGTSTEYFVNDIVVHGGNTYVCLVQHTSGTFATDLAANRWEVFNSGIRWRNTWASSTAYLTNDVVRNVDSSYIATEDHTSSGSFATDLSAGKWQLLARGADDLLPTLTGGEEGYALSVEADGITLAWINPTGADNIFYVTPDGNDTNPGTSLTLPFASIQAAVAAATTATATGNPTATIFVKSGTYSEAALPIVVPPNTAIVGDSLRTVIVEPAAGLAADGVTDNDEATMFLLSNGSILNKMSFRNMTGWVPGATASDITTSTPKGIFVALNPNSAVTTKSPYIVECSAFGSGCIGALVDGSAQNSGYHSMLFYGYTVIADNGVGIWVKDGGRSEVVSCFTYYAYFGYAASGGGVMRSLNGNNSYGTWGATSFGFSADETPLTGALYGEQLTVTLDPIPEGFTAGSTITGATSGATGTVTSLQASAGKIYYKADSGTFQNGEDISDGTYTLTIAGDGVSGQDGFLLIADGFSSEPVAGSSIEIAGDSSAYVIQSVSGSYVDSSTVMALSLVQEKTTASADAAAVTIRNDYSQIRLTGHDFLSVGTGGTATTNYPGIPSQAPAQGNEVEEELPGRVYYVTTDQDGNFRVGDFFRVDQGTGRATLNASAFDLSGLTSLQLGSIGAKLGETINEFSSDATLGGANPTNVAVPTEAAVKTYVDSGTSTLTNKTIAFGSNTLTDVASTNTAQTLTNKVLDTTLLSANNQEKATVSATAATGTINFDASTQQVLYYTTNASGNFTVNIRGDGSNTLDSLMDVGDSITMAFLVKNGGTAYYNNAVQVDGSAVTPMWQGGAAPAEGNADSVDVYSYVVVKTGSATFSVFASQTQFA